MSNTSESYNLINYLKIVDLSLLNILDYIEINESTSLVEKDDKLILNLNATSKKLLEGFIINNINNETYYGKRNILINSCKPVNNWRNIDKKVKSPRIVLNDESIYIDEIKLNNLADSIFKKLPTLTAVFSKKTSFKEVSNIQVSIQKELKLIEFEELDLSDSYVLLNRILSSFGVVNRDSSAYNLINDGNNVYFHNVSEISDGLYQKVQYELMQKGII